MGYKLKRILIYPDGVTEKQVYPAVPPLPDYLCFTAYSSDSIKLTKTGSPTAVTLETSTDGINWTTYTFGSWINLSNGDKIYWRNTSTTTTNFSSDSGNYYVFSAGRTSASGDVTSLINKNCTTTIPNNGCFYYLFNGCSRLKTAPKLPATSLKSYCYYQMFGGCSSLETLPNLPANSLPSNCYYYMFYGCSNIKLSTTQTGEYQNEYRIPTTGNGSVGTDSLKNMFAQTGGTFTGTPSINTTYYTSNTIV